MIGKIPFRHTRWVDSSVTVAAAGAAIGAGVLLSSHPMAQWFAEVGTFAAVALGLTQLCAVKRWGHAWRGWPRKGGPA